MPDFEHKRTIGAFVQVLQIAAMVLPLRALCIHIFSMFSHNSLNIMDNAIRRLQSERPHILSDAEHRIVDDLWKRLVQKGTELNKKGSPFASMDPEGVGQS